MSDGKPDNAYDDVSWRLDIPIAKQVPDKMQVFGWLSVVVEPDGTPVIDLHGDVIEIENLETVVYHYVRHSRIGGAMHTVYAGELIESIVFTPEKIAALGIPAGVLPLGWWVGYQVLDPDIWAMVKSGELTMFSIGGTGRRKPLEAPVERD